MHYVYIIYSSEFRVYYKGETVDPIERLIKHNLNLSEYTKGKGPWDLVFIEALEDRSKALKREKQIKKLKHRSILKLIEGPTNIIKTFK